MNTEIIDLSNSAELIKRVEQKETAGLKLCQTCAGQLPERDKFCRHCGTSQNEHIPVLAEGEAPELSTYVTSRLSQRDIYHSFSGPLTSSIVTYAAVSTSRLKNRIAKLAISALIAIPLWLTIVLLSPLDAYSTGKAILNHH
jgi:hypothetical protein